MGNIQKISVALPVEMVTTLKSAVDGGNYSSASEVIREALRDWQEKQSKKKAAIAELRRAVREGLQSGPGRFSSMDEIKAEARRRFERAKSRA